MSVRVGIALSQGLWPPDRTGHQMLWEFVDRCEASAIDSIWVSDRIVGPGRVLEPVTILAALAGRTRRLKFGPSILALPLRNPVVLAKELATIDYISNGRLLPAVGLGTDNEAEYTACGVRKSERARRTDEAIVLMRRLWTEERVTHDGRFYHCMDVTIEPKPIQRPPPIWIGGRSDAAYLRTAKLGDGWLPAAISPEETAEGVQSILRYAQELRRPFDRGHFGALVGYCIADSPAEARTLVNDPLLRRRPDLLLEEYTALGTPEDVCALLRRYIQAGASKFVLRPICPQEHLLRQVGLLAEKVIPAVHD